MRVLFLQNIPSPYRVKFFSLLGNLVDLTVLYELRNASNRDDSWKAEEVEITYKEVFLNTKRIISDGGIGIDVLSYLTRDYDFIIVGTHGTPTSKLAMFYMRTLGIPYILNVDGMLSSELAGKSYINRQLRRLLFKGANAYFTSGCDTDYYIKQLGIDIINKCYHYHFSSIENKDIVEYDVEVNKEQLKNKLGVVEKHMILCVTRFIPKKGVEVLINAFTTLNRNDIALVVIGGDESIYDEVLINVNKKIRQHIFFPGFMQEAKLCQYYMAADVFVLPTHHDEWGLVINEAMAKGLPIITTDMCGAGLEIIKNGENGFVIHDNDECELKNKIEYLIDNKEVREYMRRKNIEVAHKYTIEAMVEDHINHFKALKRIGTR